MSRKTDKGIPVYDDANDVFILSGAEDLVHVSGTSRYRPRTELLFALIEHQMDSRNNFWQVKGKDGFISQYGTPGESGRNSSTLTDPNDASNIFS